MGAREPEHVGIEEEEDDHEDSQQIHVEHEQDSRMIEVPTRMADTAVSVGAADERNQGGDKNQYRRLRIGKAGEEIRGRKTSEDEDAAAQGRRSSRIENAESHAVGEVAVSKNRL